MWQACSWADHLLGLGRRFRFCDGTSRTRPIIISGAPSKVAIKVCVLFIISFEFCDAVSRRTISRLPTPECKDGESGAFARYASQIALYRPDLLIPAAYHT